MKSNNSSRRQMLKKASAFVVPTLVSFKISELKVHASGGQCGSGYTGGNNNQNKWRNTNQNGNNGNHYGNDKPDYNPKDWKNWHNKW